MFLYSWLWNITVFVSMFFHHAFIFCRDVFFFPYTFFFLWKLCIGFDCDFFCWSLLCENSFRKEEWVRRAFQSFMTLKCPLLLPLRNDKCKSILWVRQDLFSSSAFTQIFSFLCICHLYSTWNLFPELGPLSWALCWGWALKVPKAQVFPSQPLRVIPEYGKSSPVSLLISQWPASLRREALLIDLGILLRSFVTFLCILFQCHRGLMVIGSLSILTEFLDSWRCVP